MLGFHWPSDIVAGTIIGIVVALLLQRPAARWLGRTRLSEFRKKRPALYHGLLFAVLVETAVMYRGSRHFLGELADLARQIS
jgi:membrane-associated phospholipid phosphatase